MEKALGGNCLIAVFCVEAGKVDLERYTENFPTGDLPIALELLRDSLTVEAPWLFK